MDKFKILETAKTVDKKKDADRIAIKLPDGKLTREKLGSYGTGISFAKSQLDKTPGVAWRNPLEPPVFTISPARTGLSGEGADTANVSSHYGGGAAAGGGTASGGSGTGYIGGIGSLLRQRQ